MLRIPAIVANEIPIAVINKAVNDKGIIIDSFILFQSVIMIMSRIFNINPKRKTNEINNIERAKPGLLQNCLHNRDLDLDGRAIKYAVITSAMIIKICEIT